MHLIQSVTSFTRTPAEGRWKDGRKTEHDDIAVIEVMTETIEHELWCDFRERLKQEFNQDEVKGTLCQAATAMHKHRGEDRHRTRSGLA